MNNDNLDDLSKLWQTEKPTAKIDIAAMQKRYRKQRRIMRFNLALELVVVISVSLLAALNVFGEGDAFSQVWVLIMAVWGWSLFIPIGLSRWRSFRLMRSESLNESVQEHIKLIHEEVLRWKLSLYATSLLLLATVSFIVVRTFYQSFSWLGLMLEILLVLGVVATVVWLYRCKKASEKVRETLLS